MKSSQHVNGQSTGTDTDLTQPSTSNGAGTARRPPKPTYLTVIPEGIPEVIQSFGTWIGWKALWRFPHKTAKKKKWIKTPIDLHTGNEAKWTTPTTWVSFQKAVKTYKTFECDGIGAVVIPGWVFNDYDGILDKDGNLIDLNTLRDAGHPWPCAPADALEKLKDFAYAERSVSGNGLHQISMGELPPNRKDGDYSKLFQDIEGKLGHKTGYEMYDSGRWFTFTGHVYEPFSVIPSVPCPIRQKALHRMFFQRETKASTNGHHPPPRTSSTDRLNHENELRTIKSGDWWKGPTFQDQLAAIITYSPFSSSPEMEQAIDLLEVKDFKPIGDDQNNAPARYLVGKTALEHYQKHREPIGEGISHAVQWEARNAGIEGRGLEALLAYVNSLKQHAPNVVEDILKKVIGYKSDRIIKCTLFDLIDSHAGGQLNIDSLFSVMDNLRARLQRQDKSLLDSPQRPRGLGRVAFHGLAGDVVRAIKPKSEADTAALLSTFVVAYANVIGRLPYFQAGQDLHYLNLYAVLVGPTAEGGKGMSLGQIKSVLAGVDAKWAADRIMGGLSSGEGLIGLVKDETTKLTPIRQKGVITGYQTEIVDKGVIDKRLLIVEQEFVNVLRMCFERHGNSLQEIIRVMFDTGDLNVATKTRQRASGVLGSIIGHITQEELQTSMNQTAMANGFVNRFLWVYSKIGTLHPRGVALDANVRDALIARIQQTVAFAQNVGLMTRSPEAEELWDPVYREDLKRGRPGLLGKTTGRGAPIVMRMACIYALLDMSSVVEVIHLKAALEVWRYSFDTCRFVFGDTTENPVANEILSELRKRGETGMTRTEINAHFHGNRSTEEIVGALTVLVKQGSARVEPEEAGSKKAGRPTELWRLC